MADMNIIDENVLTSTIFLATSIPILWIGFFFLMQPKGEHVELKNIVTWLFIVWGAHFAVVGLQLLYQVVMIESLFPTAVMKLLSASFVFIEFVILLRFYFYIRRNHE